MLHVVRVVVDADVSGGIRRACSLSDLASAPSKHRVVHGNPGSGIINIIF